MEQWGLPIGVGLLAIVTLCAVALARKAARGVSQFREEHHETFLGKNHL